MLDSDVREWLSSPSCSVAQAAKMLGISKPGVINAIERGELRGTRIGRRIVIPTAQLRKMLMVEDASASMSDAA